MGGENADYEAIVTDVENTLVENPNLNTMDRVSVVVTDLNNPPSYSGVQIFYARMLEQLQRERKYEKEWHYNPKHIFNF